MLNNPGKIEYGDGYWEGVANGSIEATPEAWASLGLTPPDKAGVQAEEGAIQENAQQQ